MKKTKHENENRIKQILILLLILIKIGKAWRNNTKNPVKPRKKITQSHKIFLGLEPTGDQKENHNYDSASVKIEKLNKFTAPKSKKKYEF